MNVHVISDMEGVSGIVRGPLASLAGDSGAARPAVRQKPEAASQRRP